GRVVLTDAEGRIIADSSGLSGAEPRDVSKLSLFAKVAAPGRPVLRAGLDEAGRLVRATSVALREPVSGWHVVAMTPQSTVDAQARQLRNSTALVALVFIFPALALAAWLAAWLSRPIRALAKTANALTAGELDAPLPAVSSSAPREMQQLTHAIRSMIQKLQQHSQQLEVLVGRRTAELSNANRELASALETIRENERRIREDIAKARLFQERMLSPLPKRAGCDLAARYAPLEDVSGDIYDVTELPDGRLRVFIVDATGHGVQASMRTIFLKSAYDRLKLDGADPSDVLSRLNEQIVTEFPEGELHSEACCLDLRLGEAGVDVSFATAGNTPLFVFSRRGSAHERYTGGPLLGVESVVAWPAPEHFPLRPGELLLISSDGLFEQWNEQRQRFDAVIAGLELVAETADASLERLLTRLESFRGQQPIGDDLTMIAVLVAPSVDRDELLGQPS
ncbi:MAG TPA: SpoIIE family protein phosphatase, partial [Polyangiaceae bacterium]|nr:SpoIIE family protein phosphatase [Polyangiaceae bacterium]